MAINFNSSGGTQPSGGYVGKLTDTSKKTATTLSAKPEAGSQGQADSVQLSNSALQVQHLSRQLAHAPDIADTEKVAQIRQAIEDGTYNIDSLQLADKMLGFEAHFS